VVIRVMVENDYDQINSDFRGCMNFLRLFEMASESDESVSPFYFKQ